MMRFAAVGITGLATLVTLKAIGVAVSPAAVGVAVGVIIALILGRRKRKLLSKGTLA
ncbi:hypothetical protein O6V14_17045 [Sphingomonas faeni]|jgi:membrane associated rhomboid family serine protease|uniref:hypothetical protein n=1 Tax=Sphingomonas sp. Leaf34 TaxID=1736216 RepID=UPI0012E28A3E|nr:hypothetical protein [Sphingomonas sp. Leaf34]